MLTALLVLGLISSCEEDMLTPEEQLMKDVAIIDEYLAENGIVAIEHITGVRYVIHDEGSGRTPDITDEVRVNYEGTLLGGTEIFDSSEDARLPLAQLIQGWQIAFQNMAEGDSATLYIPSLYGYGRLGNSVIPPDANLEFEVRLFRVYEF